MGLNNSFFTLFSNINNGILAKKNIIQQNKSKKVLKFIKILLKEGFIQNYKFSTKNENIIYIFLKINNFKKIIYISKPSKKNYIKSKQIRNKSGFFILSTSYGFFTNQELLKYKYGGELICQILC